MMGMHIQKVKVILKLKMKLKLWKRILEGILLSYLSFWLRNLINNSPKKQQNNS